MENLTRTTRTDIMLVDPSNIVLVGDNIRTDMGDLEALADSIMEIGIQVPLKGKKIRGEDKYELADGHRRFAAIQLLIERGESVGKLPVLPYNGNSEDRLFTMLATGVGQKELTPIEQSEGVKKLTLLNYSVDEIAKKIGKSVPHIYHLLKLQEAPKRVKDLVNDGKVSVQVVVDAVRQTDDPAEQTELVYKAIETARENGKTKATLKHVGKKITPLQRLNSLIARINQQKERTEKMEWFLEMYDSLKKSDSVEDVLNLFQE